MKNKTMTKEQRHNFYKKMLRDYRLSIYLPKIFFNTLSGFCLYIKYKTKGLDLEDFPELYEQKPEKPYSCMFWFSPGELKPRIYCIKEAIKLCENETE